MLRIDISLQDMEKQQQKQTHYFSCFVHDCRENKPLVTYQKTMFRSWMHYNSYQVHWNIDAEHAPT